jgi:hypothetical protein
MLTRIENTVFGPLAVFVLHLLLELGGLFFVVDHKFSIGQDDAVYTFYIGRDLLCDQVIEEVPHHPAFCFGFLAVALTLFAVALALLAVALTLLPILYGLLLILPGLLLILHCLRAVPHGLFLIALRFFAVLFTLGPILNRLLTISIRLYPVTPGLFPIPFLLCPLFFLTIIVLPELRPYCFEDRIIAVEIGGIDPFVVNLKADHFVIHHHHLIDMPLLVCSNVFFSGRLRGIGSAGLAFGDRTYADDKDRKREFWVHSLVFSMLITSRFKKGYHLKAPIFGVF